MKKKGKVASRLWKLFMIVILFLLFLNMIVLHFGNYGDKCFVPERRRKFVYMINSLHEVFQERGLTYWIDGGTLLGAYRYGDVIPWDHDADVSYLRDETFHKITDGGELQKVFKERYGIYINGARMRMEKEGDTSDEQPYVDLRSWVRVKDNSYLRPSREWSRMKSWQEFYNDFPVEWVTPTEKIRFAGNPNISCPNSIETYLKKRYPHSFYFTISYTPNCYLPWNFVRWVFK